MNFLNKKARKEIENYVRSSFTKINPEAGECRFNWQCHSNAIHEARKQNHDKAALVVYIEGGYPIVHFLNYDNEIFTDNTLGNWCYNFDYYLIRFIDKSEFNDIYNIHKNYRLHLRRQLSFWTRLFSNYKG